eukprot:scaffold14478_cov73-Phaeocystis_antarctica.AAC.2
MTPSTASRSCVSPHSQKKRDAPIRTRKTWPRSVHWLFVDWSSLCSARRYSGPCSYPPIVRFCRLLRARRARSLRKSGFGGVLN